MNPQGTSVVEAQPWPGSNPFSPKSILYPTRDGQRSTAMANLTLSEDEALPRCARDFALRCRISTARPAGKAAMATVLLMQQPPSSAALFKKQGAAKGLDPGQAPVAHGLATDHAPTGKKPSQARCSQLGRALIPACRSGGRITPLLV